jgi:acyl-homoserine lactone synthase
MLYIEHGKVLGYLGMLPTTRPHLLSEVMPELCEVEPPVGAHIWEISRHCVAPGHRSGGRFAGAIANALGSGSVEWGLECGVSNFIIEIEPRELLPLIQLHFQPMPLGLPRKIDGQDVMAVMLAFDERTLERFRELRGSRKKSPLRNLSPAGSATCIMPLKLIFDLPGGRKRGLRPPAD